MAALTGAAAPPPGAGHPLAAGTRAAALAAPPRRPCPVAHGALPCAPVAGPGSAAAGGAIPAAANSLLAQVCPWLVGRGLAVLGLGFVGVMRKGRTNGRSGRGVCRRSSVTAPASAPLPQSGSVLRVVVFGATGYIGRAVVAELASRRHSVVAVTREQSGIGGKQSLADVEQLFEGSSNVTTAVGDVTDETSMGTLLSSQQVTPDAAVCCLASRTGGRKDSFDIDYQATVNCMRAAREAGVQHFVLLSAVCVQRPLLAFQEAKLLAEKELKESSGKMAFSIVQPTAFFKSLLGQVKGVQSGAPFVMFGDGTEVRCKPISEEDLASFIADCLWDPAKRNAVLPVGGPGPAMSFKEQGDLLFQLLGKEPNFICVPYAVFDVVQAVLDFLAGLLPDAFSDLSEYGRIGRYYAEQSMLVLDPATGRYSEAMTPSYGKTTLRDFLEDALREDSQKLEAQQLGEQGLGSRVGIE
eukprot:CAMPEP_0179050384 /NCGR_PEP_ID=MMETSP0796-20121207/20697_1 /TAXON_ID=73915 /ORGANISM="Pyrodinium bahamense, Strain pbaha01" /LENGTH=467 /DNA_ID=CAMNT_0020746883 /DNA_START=114 /DNA_END=1518 /DNA_ORIENTATION=+